MTIRLASAEILELSGPGAVSFAHSQFSSDVRALANEDWQWSAWLDAQGRVQNFFALLRPSPERLIVWQPYGSAEAMEAQLKRYVMRSKVKLVVLKDWSLLDASDDSPSSARLTQSDDGFAFDLPGAKFRRALLSPASMQAPAGDDARNQWLLEDIAAGLPWIANEVSGKFVAAALDLRRLDATSLEKGCYPGQEIVARLHYRGGNKRRCYRLDIADGVAPTAGEEILSSDSDIACGFILYSARDAAGGSKALAILSEATMQSESLRLRSGANIQRIELASAT